MTGDWKACTLAIGLALLPLCASGSGAAEERPGWEVEVAPYGWLAGNYGSLTVKGRSARIDVTPSDVYQLLEDGNAFAGSGYLSVRYDRWSVFADAFGGYAEEGATEQIPIRRRTLDVAATAKLRFALSDFAIGYQLGRWSLPGRRRLLTLGVYTGTRYEYFNTKLGVSAGVVGAAQHVRSVFKSWAWADPLIGVRWEVPVLDRLSLDFRGDIGGFGASSELVWGLVGGVRYWLPWTPWTIQPWLGAGYRVVAFDRRFASNDMVDLQVRGPTGGMGLVF
jgi:hypothetical protein